MFRSFHGPPLGHISGTGALMTGHMHMMVVNNLVLDSALGAGSSAAAISTIDAAGHNAID